MWTWMAAFAAAWLGGDDAGRTGSLIAFITIASGSVGCVLAGRWADDWGKAQVAGTAMIASAACCALSPYVFVLPAGVLVALPIVWGFTVVADSAQLSALVTEHTPRTHVGTAPTLPTSAGFLLTMVSMRLLPVAASAIGWRWAFLVLVPGPFLGAPAMKSLEELEIR